eukprot:15469363-Alexandrium_andersonii.AAC.1
MADPLVPDMNFGGAAKALTSATTKPLESCHLGQRKREVWAMPSTIPCDGSVDCTRLGLSCVHRATSPKARNAPNLMRTG